MNSIRRAALLALVGAFCVTAPATAQAPAPPDSPADHILLTVFLKHDQSKSIDQILAALEESGFWKAFPPAGVEVQSWVVAMGIGQVVTLKVPPAKLRAVNVALERTAWGPFRTEFYASYDLMPTVAALKARATAE